MAAKRTAERELTDRNWDEEDEPEDPGVFKQASSEVIQHRVVRKAKRKGVVGSGEGATSGAFKTFAGFGGFGGKTSDPAPKFSFGADTSKPSSGVSNGTSPDAKKTTSFFSIPKEDAKGKPNGDATKSSETNGTGATKSNRSQFLAQLKALNKSVSKCIADHVSKDACVILTPIFKDYEKHLENLKKKYQTAIPTENLTKDKSDDVEETKRSSGTSDSESTTTSSLATASSSTAGSSIFGNMTTSSSTAPFTFGDKPASTSGFSFKPSSTSTLTSSTDSSGLGSFKFGSSGESSGASGFKFGSGSDSKPFTFAVAKPTTTDSEQNAGEGGATEAGEEEYVPPKEEVKEVTEDDAYYTKRCKMFYKKDDKWIEKGVGNLHLKKLDDEKTQLLVRADTNLGNILLNIKVNSSMPAGRQGKNNVSLFCIPNPPISEKEEEPGKPYSLLIRVKTSEDADELFQKIEEAKKA